MANKIIITQQSCDGLPMIWDCIMPDGSEGYIRYRWSIISLKRKTERCGLFQEPEISEMIGDPDGLDGMLPVDEAIKWLESKGYEVENKIPFLPWQPIT